MMKPIDNKAVLYTWSSSVQYVYLIESILELAAGHRF